MKIKKVRILNFMKIKLLDIKPSGSVIQFAGRNGQGKTSAALAIIGALGGKKALAKAMKLSKDPGDEEIIRRGAEMSEVEVKFGGWVVTWTRNRGGAEKVEIRGTDGGTHGRAKLAEFVSAVTFDPLAVDAMSPAERRETLLKAVGIDLEEIDLRHDVAYQRRRTANRDHKLALARVGNEIDGAPGEAIDIESLEENLEKAQRRHGENLEQRQQAASLDMRAGGHRDAFDRAATEAGRAEGDAKRLPEQHTVRRKLMARRHKEELAGLAEGQEQEAKVAEERAGELRLAASGFAKVAAAATATAKAALEAADKLIETPVEPLRRAIGEGREANELHRMAQERLGRHAEAERLGAESRDLTATLAKIDAEKVALLAGAKMPIEGIEITGDDVTIGGHLWEAASTSDRIQACVAILAALSPELKIAFIRSGNDLDAETCAIFEAECKDRGLQAWIERGKAAFKDVIVIENGLVAK